MPPRMRIHHAACGTSTGRLAAARREERVTRNAGCEHWVVAALNVFVLVFVCFHMFACMYACVHVCNVCMCLVGRGEKRGGAGPEEVSRRLHYLLIGAPNLSLPPCTPPPTHLSVYTPAPFPPCPSKSSESRPPFEPPARGKRINVGRGSEEDCTDVECRGTQVKGEMTWPCAERDMVCCGGFDAAVT